MKPEKPAHKEKESHLKRITRRSFIHLAQCTGVGAILGMNRAFGQIKPLSGAERHRYTPRFPGNLVHVRDNESTFWDFSTGWYGYHVDQVVVDKMVEAGLLELTNTTTVSEAWKLLVPKYTAGQKFAIKVNFNNFSHSGPDPDPDIGALIEPVNALVRTLVLFGVPEQDISVYDVTHGAHSGSMPQISFINRCLYPGVNFVYHYGNPNPFSATQFIEFNPPTSPSIPDLAIANVVVDCDYLIDMFVPKAHSLAGVTLGFKNHLGSYDHCQDVHNHMPYSYYYNPSYSSYIDTFKNRHFGPKTVLTICDGLFGNWKGVNGGPRRWNTFNFNAPNSIFLSADPVAIDSVLTDYIEIERKSQGYSGVINGTRDYLVLAEEEQFGIHESADPWISPIGSDYKRIRYSYIDGV